ncbi:MAG: hypothetical protein KIT73_18180, partial [Burkholderiales bacterium]|nr:hypothetical protein [Burkholderiales bacterium]
ATGVKGDWLAGGMGDDTLVGSGAADALTGGQGNDLIVAGAGDDVISGDLNVVLARETNRADWSITPFPAPAFDAWWNGVVAEGESDDGDDVVHAGGGSDLVFGLGGDDALYGDTGADRMAGGAGDDRLFGGDGADELVGDGGVPAPGSTTVVAHSADHIDGGAGDDTLSGEGGDDVLYGGDGDDLMDGDANRLDFIASGFDYLHGEAGNDTMRGGMRDDYLSGGDGDDRADGEDGDDTLDGGAGNDVLEGGDGADDLSGGSGHDVLWGEAGADTLAGGSGDDTLRGWAGNDVLLGETGDDWLFGEEGDDAMDGGAGADRLSGSWGNDLIDGGDGDDIADGHEGNDELWGGAGDDTLNGGDGDDLLIGGAGADLLDGGIGSDTYVIDRYDRIVDGGGATTLVLTGGINAEDLRAREGMVDGRPSIVYEAAGHALMALQSGSNARPLSIELHSGVIAGHAIAVRPYGADIVATGDDSSDDMLGFSGDDWIEGRNGADLLAGAAGEDTLLGGLGDDSLNGGAGNDVLIGGPGSDSYRFSSGDGIDVIREADLHSDRIEFAGSIDRSSVRLTRTPTGDLVIHHGETDRVTVERFFEAPGYQIEQIRFADGSTIEYAELEAVPIGPVSGTTGDDHMTGSSAADTLIGGSGNDTYVLGWGIGADEVVEVAGETSAIVLQGGIRTDDLVIRRHDGDLVLSLGTEDGLRVRDGAAQAGDWWVHDGGGVRSLATLIADRDDENLTERFRREYRVAAMARVAEELRFQGYVPTADGLFERMDAVAHGRAYVDDVEWSIRDANGTLLGVVQEQRLENLPVTFTGHAFRMAEADRPVESRVDQVTGAPVERYVVRASAFAAEPLSAEALAPYAEFGPLTVVGVVNRTEYGVVYRLGEGDTPIQRDLRVETRSWSSGIRGTDGDDDLQYPSRGGAWIEA